MTMFPSTDGKLFATKEERDKHNETIAVTVTNDDEFIVSTPFKWDRESYRPGGAGC